MVACFVNESSRAWSIFPQHGRRYNTPLLSDCFPDFSTPAVTVVNACGLLVFFFQRASLWAGGCKRHRWPYYGEIFHHHPKGAAEKAHRPRSSSSGPQRPRPGSPGCVCPV